MRCTGRTYMKDKILKDALEWYDKHEKKHNVLIEDFVDLVIDKTTVTIIDKIKDELQEEFKKGNLKHSFIISSDYYLYLKLKEIKDKFVEIKKTDEEVPTDKYKICKLEDQFE